MKKISKFVVALLCVAGSAGAMAQGVVNRPQLSAALANELVGDTVAICAKQGYKVWAVVVNLDGVRQALLRGDGAPIHSQDNGYYKAYTAASLTLGRNENSTKEIAAKLLVSVKTVETYKSRALEKLGLYSRVDVVKYAAQRGWLAGE